MMFEPVYETTIQAKIKIVGVGGGGCNAVNHLGKTADLPDSDVELYAINTDAQVLRHMCGPVQTVQIGANTTKGLG